MLLNGIELVERFQRPSPTSRLGLRMSFLNNGSYILPFAVKSCTIFPRLANLTPNTVLGDDGLISPEAAQHVLMNFSGTGFEYVPGSDASGIYTSGANYIAVLDGTVDLSGVYEGQEIANQCSATQEYIDVWTVRLFENSEDQVFINTFKLEQNSLIGLTQQPLLNVHNRLVNKHIPLGSNVSLKITTDVTVENRDIDETTKNAIQHHPLTNVSVQIKKINEDSSLPSDVVIQEFTSDGVSVTPDNTITYKLNATPTFLIGDPLSPNNGGVVGTYAITARFLVLDELIVTKPLYFTIR